MFVKIYNISFTRNDASLWCKHVEEQIRVWDDAQDKKDFLLLPR